MTETRDMGMREFIKKSLALFVIYLYSTLIFRCREMARKEMNELIKIMDTDNRTKKVARLKDWFVAREAQMAQLSLDGNLKKSAAEIFTISSAS